MSAAKRELFAGLMLKSFFFLAHDGLGLGLKLNLPLVLA
jgi:hypothetical protein